VALRKSGLLADLLERTWEAAIFYPKAFSMELAAWKTVPGWHPRSQCISGLVDQLGFGIR
jgi:hypothetical protein